MTGMNSRQAKDYDVVIVGGGPAGTSAAIRLASGGAHVLLAEQKKFPRAKLCGEFISPECLDHFAQLGVTQQMTTVGGARLKETVFIRATEKAFRSRASGSVRAELIILRPMLSA